MGIWTLEHRLDFGRIISVFLIRGYRRRRDRRNVFYSVVGAAVPVWYDHTRFN